MIEVRQYADTCIAVHTLEEAVHWMDQVRFEMKGISHVHPFW